MIYHSEFPFTGPLPSSGLFAETESSENRVSAILPVAWIVRRALYPLTAAGVSEPKRSAAIDELTDRRTPLLRDRGSTLARLIVN